jgi:hypothetical protein
MAGNQPYLSRAFSSLTPEIAEAGFLREGIFQFHRARGFEWIDKIIFV